MKGVIIMSEFNVARQAILNEIEGAAFYSLGAEKSADSEVKEALLHLKNQELEHKEWLLSLYKYLELSVTSPHLEWETLQEIEDRVKEESQKNGEAPTLFKKAEKKFKLVESDMAVFAAGALMEKESIQFYTEAAKQSNNKNAKRLFSLLAEWEKEHLNELNTIHDALMKQWLAEYEFTYSPKL